MMKKTMVGLALAIGVIGTPGCAPGDGEPGPTPVAETGATLETEAVGALPDDIEAMGIRNTRMPAPNLLTGGQLTREQMASLRKLGYRTFINLRRAEESGTGWEEEFTGAERIDIIIPVAGAAGITRENAERLAGALADAEPDPAVLLIVVLSITDFPSE